MKKHTPGPWKARETIGGWQIFSGAMPVRVHSEENATLIAAAPDLLQAALCALADLQGLRGDAFFDDHPANETITELEEAIAKVEGVE